MFKYLYLLFADKEDMIFDIEDYIFTTEAHLLPLWLSTTNQTISKKNTVSNLRFNGSVDQFLFLRGSGRKIIVHSMLVLTVCFV